MFSLFWPLKLVFGVFRFCLNLLVFAACVLTVLSFMGDRGWLWSLSTHFHAQYLAVQAVALVAFVLSAGLFSKRERESAPVRLEHWLSLVGLLFFMGLNAVCIAPYYLTPPPGKAEYPRHARPVKLMHANLFGITNHHPAEAIAAIRAENPDLLDLVEYTPDWQTALERSGLLRRYPYRVAKGGHIALYSKLPLRNARLGFADVRQKVANQANITAQITLNGQPVTLLVAHPASPVRPSHLAWLQESYAAWARQRRSLGENLVIVGDLNSSPWSVEFQTLTRATALRDSQLGYGLQPTWPVILPVFGLSRPQQPIRFLSFFGIPIDHLLVSDRLVVLSRHTGPFIGSDHLPVVAELGVLPPGPSARR